MITGNKTVHIECEEDNGDVIFHEGNLPPDVIQLDDFDLGCNPNQGRDDSVKVKVSGTPSNNEIAIWTNADTLQGVDAYEYYVSTSSFLFLVTAANSSGVRTIIVVDEDVTISSNITVNANVTLRFIANKKITVETTYVLTLNGRIEADSYDQVFSVSEVGAVAGTPINREYYPEWFGAVRNGTTDDVLPIQSAAKLVENCIGGVLRFHAGEYLCSSYIYIASNTVVQGAGQGINGTRLIAESTISAQTYIHVTASATVDFYRASMFSLGIKNGSGAGSTTHVSVSVSNVKIRDLYIDMHDDDIGYPHYGTDKTTTVAILAERRAYESTVSYEDIEIERVQTKETMISVALGLGNLGTGNPYISASTLINRNFTIRDMIIDGCKNKGVEFYGVDGGQFENNTIVGGDGVQILGYCKNVSINDNKILYHGIGISVTNWAENITVSGNTLEYNPDGVYGSAIGGNYIGILLGYQISSSYGSEWTDFIQRNITISNNTIIDEHTTNKWCIGIGTAQVVTSDAPWLMKDIVFSGNVVTGNVSVLPYATNNQVSIEVMDFTGNRIKGTVLAPYGLIVSSISFYGGSISVAPNINTALSGGINFNGVLLESGITIGTNPINCSVVGCTYKSGAISVAGATNTSANNVSIN
jgi:hypothetical protein